MLDWSYRSIAHNSRFRKVLSGRNISKCMSTILLVQHSKTSQVDEKFTAMESSLHEVHIYHAHVPIFESIEKYPINYETIDTAVKLDNNCYIGEHALRSTCPKGNRRELPVIAPSKLSFTIL